jgi:hypothetical protein
LEASLLIGARPAAPFITEDGYVKCWRGKDRRYYCCPRHADFGLLESGHRLFRANNFKSVWRHPISENIFRGMNAGGSKMDLNTERGS